MCYQSVTSFGTPGDPWATRFAAAEAAADNICVPPGTYAIGSNLTLTKNWQILDGAILQPASGVTVRFAGSVQARRYHIFDLSAGGTAAFESGATDGLPPQWWGAATDGLTQSTAAIQAALNASADSGIAIDLGAIPYLVNAPLQLTGSVAIVGAEGGTTFSTVAHNHPIFKTAVGAETIRISRIRAAGEKVFLEIAGDFIEIALAHNAFEGIADSITNYFVYREIDDPVVAYTAETLRVCENQLRQCTAVYADAVRMDDFVFNDNVVRDGTRFVIRARNTTDLGPDNSDGPTRVIVCRNQFLGVNTGLSEPVLGQNVARVLQTAAVESITMTDNHIERLITQDTGTVVYWGHGSLEFGRNTVTHVESQTTGNHIISDKSGPVSDPARYSHRCYDNVFDQSGVSLERTPDAVYKVGAAQNFVSDNDTFIGCRCPTHSVNQASVPQEGVPPAIPQNVVLQNATVIDHRYPAIVELVQYQKNVVVRGFTVHQISNPDNRTPIGGETRLRFATLYVSRTETFELPDMEDISIRDNTILQSDSTFVIAVVNRHPNAANVEIRNVVIHGNVTRDAAALCRFVNGPNLGSVTLTNNVAPVSTLSVGTLPPALTLEGNAPAPSGSHVWVPGSIAAGDTETRWISVPGARVGDFAEVTPSIVLPAGLVLQAAVTATDTVTASLTNVTTSAISVGTHDMHARVTYR